MKTTYYLFNRKLFAFINKHQTNINHVDCKVYKSSNKLLCKITAINKFKH